MVCPSASSLDLGGVMSYAPHSVINAATPNFSLSSFLILTVSCSKPSHKRALLGYVNRTPGSLHDAGCVYLSIFIQEDAVEMIG